MQKIILRGQPKSTQHCYAYTCRGRFACLYMNGKCKALKEDYITQARQQCVGDPITDDVKVVVHLYFGTKRQVDWDNFHKLSMDALEGIVFENDSQIQEAHVFKHYDKEDPRIEITVDSHVCVQ